jgi:MFS superfamily sulfate permease-like transporter
MGCTFIFCQCSTFPGKILKVISDSPTQVKRIIVTAEPVTSVDISSADMLIELKKILDASQIELHFAEMKDP